MILCSGAGYKESFLLKETLKIIFLAVVEEAVVVVIEDELFLYLWYRELT